MLYYNNKKYLNINEWVGVLNKLYSKYNIHVQARDVHQLFHHYGLKPIKTNSKRERSTNGNITWFSESSFNTIRYRDDFMKVLHNITNFGDARGQESVYTPTVKDNKEQLTYKNDEDDMEKHSQNLEKVYQIENNIKNTKKKIVISESAFKKLFENQYQEGGVFHVKPFARDQKVMDTDYEYVDDNNDPNIYVDFSNAGLKSHPRSNDWVEYPWVDDRLNQNKGYETLNKNNPRKPKIGDTIVKGARNKYYMPARQSFSKGDNIQIIPRRLPLQNNEFVYCYNLSMLGSNKGGSTATMMAHYYKGKDVTYKGDLKLNGKNGQYFNLKGYLRNMISAIKSTPQISDFNPDFIVYPESSSKFNDDIARYLQRFIFPNAQIKPKGWIKKTSSWEYSYDDLWVLLNDSLENGMHKSMFKKHKNKSYTDYFVSEIYVAYCVQLITKKIISKLPLILTQSQSIESVIEKQDFIYDKIVNVVQYESFKIEKVLQKNKIRSNFFSPFTLLKIFNTLFTDEKIGKYNQKTFSKTKGKRENIYKDLKTFQKHFISNEPDVFFNEEKILNNKTKDTIKNYDNIARLSIGGQFDLQDIDGLDENTKFVIIDDNYASGASLRNVVNLLIEKGFNSQNIICITPGDMGQAGTGGKQGPQNPYNYAEAQLADDYVEGNLPSEIDIDADSEKNLIKLHNQLYRNPSHKQRYVHNLKMNQSYFGNNNNDDTINFQTP